jgi:hypothetical protein
MAVNKEADFKLGPFTRPEQGRPPGPASDQSTSKIAGAPAVLESAEHAFWSWLGFWAQMLVLGVVAVLGAFAASSADRAGDYACGMLLMCAALALAFLRLKQKLDGVETGWSNLILIDDLWNLALVIPLFTLIGLAGLFAAHAWQDSTLHSAGVALFIVSGAIIFLNLKNVFDRMEPPGG